MRKIIKNSKYPGFVLQCNEQLVLDSGKRLDKFTDNNFHIEKSVLIKTDLNTFREKFPVLKDADDFNLL